MNATTLRDLLQQVIDERKSDGLPASYRDLEELVKAEERDRPRGLSLNRTTASQIVRGSHRGSPWAGTVRAIAWLANVPEADAFAAAGQSPPGPPFANDLPPGVDDLSPKERRAAVEVLRAFVSLRQEINAYEHKQHRADSPAPSGASTAAGKGKKKTSLSNDAEARATDAFRRGLGSASQVKPAEGDGDAG